MASQVQTLLGAGRESRRQQGLSEGGAVLVFAHEHRDVARGEPAGEVVLDAFDGPGRAGLLSVGAVFADGSNHVDRAVEGVVGGLGRRAVRIQCAEGLRQHVGHRGEKPVVELHHGAA